MAKQGTDTTHWMNAKTTKEAIDEFGGKVKLPNGSYGEFVETYEANIIYLLENISLESSYSTSTMFRSFVSQDESRIIFSINNIFYLVNALTNEVLDTLQIDDSTFLNTLSYINGNYFLDSRNKVTNIYNISTGKFVLEFSDSFTSIASSSYSKYCVGNYKYLGSLNYLFYIGSNGTLKRYSIETKSSVTVGTFENVSSIYAGYAALAVLSDDTCYVYTSYVYGGSGNGIYINYYNGSTFESLEISKYGNDDDSVKQMCFIHNNNFYFANKFDSGSLKYVNKNLELTTLEVSDLGDIFFCLDGISDGKVFLSKNVSSSKYLLRILNLDDNSLYENSKEIYFAPFISISSTKIVKNCSVENNHCIGCYLDGRYNFLFAIPSKKITFGGFEEIIEA